MICSYPGIQCKFFYNKNSDEITGCECETKCALNKIRKIINAILFHL